MDACLADHPKITLMSQGRGGGYGPAATFAAPQAVQAANRRDLLENASGAFLELLRLSISLIR